ncbi:MAG: hypothetical protein REJ50_16935, partial [Bordetella sp.]|nr:hypothetical protein [Bordetella sp.]
PLHPMQVRYQAALRPEDRKYIRTKSCLHESGHLSLRAMQKTWRLGWRAAQARSWGTSHMPFACRIRLSGSCGGWQDWPVFRTARLNDNRAGILPQKKSSCGAKADFFHAHDDSVFTRRRGCPA